MRSLKIISLSVIIFLICGAPDIRFQSLRPALINVPNHIQTLAVINRSETTTGVFEKVVTAELPHESKIASQAAIDGFAGFLQDARRFTIIRTGKTLSKQDRPGAFPDPLPWDEVAKICNEFKSDGLVALEVFNSDYIIPTNMVIVTTGFRLYDVKERRIVDQELYRHETYWKEPVNTIAGAINRLVEKDRVIKDASYDAGIVYAKRLAPTWFPLVRTYYKRSKGDPNIKIGARMMEVNNWDEAIVALSEAVNSRKLKTRGRAAHNLAVVYEILGDLETAKAWAQDAWGKYRNKGSKNYSYILSQRMTEARILESQEAR